MCPGWTHGPVGARLDPLRFHLVPQREGAPIARGSGGDASARARTATTAPASPGRADVRWSDVPHGNSTWRVALWPQRLTLCTVPDVVVPPPEPPDPRLVDIALRDAVRAVELGSSDPQGEALGWCRDFAMAAGGERDGVRRG